MKYTILLFFGLCLFLSTLTKAQKFTFEEVPDWVIRVDTVVESNVSKYDVKSGFYISMIDYQVNLAEDAYFRHQITNIISLSGITNASQIAVNYDTSYQELKIHYLYIWRKGKKTDRTRELSLEILNNEQNLHRGIYSGQITAYDILEDIRMDDRIDFAYTLIGNNPIFESEKYLLYPLEFMNPIDYYSLRVIYPQESDYIYECVDCDEKNFSKSTIDGVQQIKLGFYNIPAVELEESMPTWSIPYKYFILSSMHSWGEVNEWAERVFALEHEQNLDDVFDEIFTGDEDMDEKINKLINYVQDDIRYMGIESGIGSIKPFTPEQVVKQRFGDCKDKSLLLVTLLKKIGVEEAYPALVNVNMRQNIDSLLPGANVFDHCIVNFDYNDTSYWVDPSIPQQGGSYKKIFNYDYGKALIIGMGTDSLRDMNVDLCNSQYNIFEEITMSSFNDPASLTIKSERYGMEADQRRALFDYVSIKDISDFVSKNLGRQFPDVEEVKDVEINDDTEGNVFITTYHYQVDGFWIDGDKKDDDELKGMRFFRFEPAIIHDFMNEQSCMPRTYPVANDYPFSLNYTIMFHFPDNILIIDDVDEFENEAFFYKEKVEQVNINTVQLSYTLKTLTNEISADSYVEICKQKKEIKKGLFVAFYFFK